MEQKPNYTDEKLAAMSDTAIQAALRKEIAAALNTCDGQHTPKLCEFRSSAEGRSKAEQMVYDQIAYGRVDSIKAALYEVERTFNPNWCDCPYNEGIVVEG